MSRLLQLASVTKSVRKIRSVTRRADSVSVTTATETSRATSAVTDTTTFPVALVIIFLDVGHRQRASSPWRHCKRVVLSVLFSQSATAIWPGRYRKYATRPTESVCAKKVTPVPGATSAYRVTTVTRTVSRAAVPNRGARRPFATRRENVLVCPVFPGERANSAVRDIINIPSANVSRSISTSVEDEHSFLEEQIPGTSSLCRTEARNCFLWKQRDDFFFFLGRSQEMNSSFKFF